MEQRSPEWIDARLGMPTASNFDKVLTASGAPSAQAQSYMCRLIGERLFGRSLEDQVRNKWMQHGIDYEDEAAIKFEEISGERTEFVGFILSKCKRWGCSPDRLIASKNEVLEIKCPSPWKHIEYTLYGPGKDYKPQVQGQMLVGGYDAVHFFSYFPGMPSKVWKFERDDSFIVKLEGSLKLFSYNLEREVNKIRDIWLIDHERVLAILSQLMPEDY